VWKIRAHFSAILDISIMKLVYITVFISVIVLLFVLIVPRPEPENITIPPLIVYTDQFPIKEPDNSTTPSPAETEIVETPEKGGSANSVPLFSEVTSPQSETEPLNKSFSEINNEYRSAIVNIFCTTEASSPLRSISGSGIIVDSQGVILTNAHIAQYYLLKDYPQKKSVDCTIRTDSPAISSYKAELLYISPTWIENNANEIVEEIPTGTGENDYAFLLVKDTVNKDAFLPPSFPAITADKNDAYVATGAPILIIGYPAGFLSGAIVTKDLYAVSTVAKIQELYTFTTSTPDMFSTGGNLTAQKGSSGGAIIGSNEKLIGMIVTSTAGETTAERDLRAITLSYINRDLIDTLGIGITEYFQGDLSQRVKTFSDTISPTLTDLLIGVIENN